MHVFFALEQYYDLKIDYDGHFSATFDERINDDLMDWYQRIKQRDEELEAAVDDADKEEIMLEYNMWKWSYPQPLSVRINVEDRREQLQERIDKLQAELDRLKEEEQ